MYCFQNKFADRKTIKRIIKQHSQCMSFTLTFLRLGKAFNYCKMIGSHVRWWNDLALSWDFIPFHRVENNVRGVSPWWNCWHDVLINMHDISMKPTDNIRSCLVGRRCSDPHHALGSAWIRRWVYFAWLWAACGVKIHVQECGVPQLPQAIKQMQNLWHIRCSKAGLRTKRVLYVEYI